jgi:carboxyl-terminal processing protease
MAIIVKYYQSFFINKFMKHILTLLLLLSAFTSKAQNADSVAIVLQNIVNHAESASLYRDQVNWDTLKPKIFALAKSAKTVPELGEALQYLLKAIGDEHGRVFHNNQLLANYYGSLKEHQKTFKPDIFNQIQSGQVYKFDAKIIENKIGYIRIVGLPMGDNQQMAKTIEDEVCKLSEKGIDKWIIDLRYNGGGNMHPMAEGLALLIGDGAVGGTDGLTPAESSQWKVENGDFYYDDYSVQLANNCKVKKNTKVAVLTSLYTASSGEAIAVIFKGRKNTRFFGEKTLGMITATDWAVIDPLTAMTISVSYYKDRNGKVYNQYVDVDEELPFVIEPLSASDTTVKRAVEWLKSKRK